jgi:hypothetical protein
VNKHRGECNTRKAGLWLSELKSCGIPLFHCIEIVAYLKPYLK